MTKRRSFDHWENHKLGRKQEEEAWKGMSTAQRRTKTSFMVNTPVQLRNTENRGKHRDCRGEVNKTMYIKVLKLFRALMSSNPSAIHGSAQQLFHFMSNFCPENSNHQNHAAVLRITHQNQSRKQTKDVLVIHPSLGSLGFGRNGIWKTGIFKGEKKKG